MTIKIPSIFTNGNQWLEKQQASILSAAVIITASSLLSAITGIIRNWLMVHYFYNSPSLDAFWASFRLPELVFQLLVIGALSAAFIPVFTKYEQQSKEQAFKMASSILNVMLLGFIAFSVVIFIFAVPITRLITGEGFSSEQVALSASMTRWMLVAQFFFAISNFLSGMIQSYKRFIIPALSPIAYNIGIILGIIFLSPTFGIYGPTFGVILGAFLHVALQIPLAIKLGFRYFPSISLKHPGVKEMYRLMVPRTLSIGINQIQLFATVFFATHLQENSLTIFTLAQQLMTFPTRLFGAPIGQAALPFLSKVANNEEYEKLKKLVVQSIHQIAFLAMPASILLLILRIPIVRFAYGSKNFPWGATVLTGKIVAILTISIVAQAIIHILIRTFYALHDTRHPLIAAFVSSVVFLGFSFLFVFYQNQGLIGLAIALSSATMIEALLLIAVLHKKIGIITFEDFWKPQAKIFLSSFLMAVFLWLPYRILDQFVFDTTHTKDLLGLTLSVGTIGMLVYIVFAVLLDVKELSMIQKLFSTFGNWKSSLARSTEVVETAGQSDESGV